MTASPENRQLASALRLVALVEDSWPSARFNDGHRERYALDVAHLNLDEAIAAVEVLKRSGREFAPSAGDVALEVARLQVDAPDWGEVKRQLVQRNRALVEARDTPDTWDCPHQRCDGSGFVHLPGNDSTDCPCRPAKLEARRKADPLHPLVREFIRDGYVTWGEVDAVGEGGRDAATLEAQMRGKWAAYAARAVQSRVIAAIEGPPTLRRLDAARTEDEPRTRGELGRPNYAAALPRG